MKKIFIKLTLFSLGFLSSCLNKEGTVGYFCPIENLLIDQSTFGSTYQTMKSVDPKGSPNEITLGDSPMVSRTFTFNKASAWESVSFYQSESRAHDDYVKFNGTLFKNDNFSGGWIKPDVDIQSTSANELEYACGYSLDVKSCEFSARYKNYNIFFVVYLDERGFSERDFIEGIKNIDKKAENCLNFTK